MIKLYEKILKMRQGQLKRYLFDTLSKSGKVINTDGFLYRKGTVPVLLVAHMDTVHDVPVKHIIREEFGNRLSSPQGLGGDDRNGVYMILKVLDTFDCHVLFVEDEEIGCVGATKFTETFNDVMDINYIIEFDRRGARDAVYYDLDSPEFERFITESSGGHFKTAQGSCSDISIIAPFLGVAAVNLSCGYYHEHHADTYTVVSEMMRSIDMAKQIIATPVGEPFPYIERKRMSLFSDWDGCGYYGGYSNGYYGNQREEYAVIFIDKNKNECCNYVDAVSDIEAVGYTLMNFQDLTYSDIWDAIPSFEYGASADIFYANGEQF